MAVSAKDWAKYGSLAGACFGCSVFVDKSGYRLLAVAVAVIGSIVLVAGLLSVLLPVLRAIGNFFRLLERALASALLVGGRLLRRFYISAMALFLRPVTLKILAESSTAAPEARRARIGTWTAHEKKYFLNSQRADVLTRQEDGSPPTRVSFTCASSDEYWRAGVILADERYDLHRNGITDAVLIHIGVTPPAVSPVLYVIECRNLTLDERLNTRGDRCDMVVKIDRRQKLVMIRVNGLPAKCVNVGTDRWLKRVYLAAWGDQHECTVEFEDIKLS